MSILATLLLCGVLLGMLAITPIANSMQSPGAGCPNNRPFSWYGPGEAHNFYTPHHVGSFQGYVTYTNGAYVYMNS